MGKGPAEGTHPDPGLSGPPPCPYLLIYDAEDAQCRRLVDWVQRRDRDGRVVAFPFQNPELVRVAPELAGLALDRGIHGFDPRTRTVQDETRALPGLLRLLPRWRWLAPLARLSPVARLFVWFIDRRG
jgi:predicted DCC family thiol-disulfide oxidoreductase YuxK